MNWKQQLEGIFKSTPIGLKRAKPELLEATWPSAKTATCTPSPTLTLNPLPTRHAAVPLADEPSAWTIKWLPRSSSSSSFFFYTTHTHTHTSESSTPPSVDRRGEYHLIVSKLGGQPSNDWRHFKTSAAKYLNPPTPPPPGLRAHTAVKIQPLMAALRKRRVLCMLVRGWSTLLLRTAKAH